MQRNLFSTDDQSQNTLLRKHFWSAMLLKMGQVSFEM